MRHLARFALALLIVAAFALAGCDEEAHRRPRPGLHSDCLGMSDPEQLCD